MVEKATFVCNLRVTVVVSSRESAGSLELSFSNVAIRDLVRDPVANDFGLGTDVISSLTSLVADFRAAWFVGEMPGKPLIVETTQENTLLRWGLAPDCVLTTSVENSPVQEFANWKHVHRIKLEYIECRGKRIL